MKWGLAIMSIGFTFIALSPEQTEGSNFLLLGGCLAGVGLFMIFKDRIGKKND